MIYCYCNTFTMVIFKTYKAVFVTCSLVCKKRGNILISILKKRKKYTSYLQRNYFRSIPVCPIHSNHSILFFHFFQSSKPFYSIPIFSTIFFNFLNPYTISLNLNHLYHLEICKVKLFFKPFFKLFSNHLEL